jgi:hypothetical protein
MYRNPDILEKHTASIFRAEVMLGSGWEKDQARGTGQPEPMHEEGIWKQFRTAGKYPIQRRREEGQVKERKRKIWPFKGSKRWVESRLYLTLLLGWGCLHGGYYKEPLAGQRSGY